MECRKASTEAECLTILRQRYDIFVEEYHFFVPKESDRRIEYDDYDTYAVLFGVWERDDLLASCRLVLPENPLGLPTSNALHIDPEKFRIDSHTAEISRIAIASKHRRLKNSIKILQSLRHEMIQTSISNGITHWIGAVEPGFLKLLNLSRLHFKPIGPLQNHIDLDRYPVALSVHDCIISLKEHP